MLTLRFSDFGEIWLLAHACRHRSKRLGAYLFKQIVNALCWYRNFQISAGFGPWLTPFPAPPRFRCCVHLGGLTHANSAPTLNWGGRHTTTTCKQPHANTLSDVHTHFEPQRNTQTDKQADIMLADSPLVNCCHCDA